VGGTEAVGGVGFDAKPDFLTGNETFYGEVVAEIVLGTDGLGLPLGAHGAFRQTRFRNRHESFT